MKLLSQFTITVFLLFFSIQLSAQKVEKVDPPHWFAGMQHSELQLLLIGEDLVDFELKLDHPAVSIISLDPLPSNASYGYLNLRVPTDFEGGELTFKINGKKKNSFSYTIKPAPSYQAQGLSQADFIYLIMPDRFANGNTENDEVEGFLQNTIDRNDGYQRHGGDLKGIEDHLDYIQELGVTALWLNPVYENDEAHESYHGYAITDFYNVDARFGGNSAYKSLVDQAHANQMKVIKDVVFNHMGDNNYLAKNPPSADWIHPMKANADSSSYFKTNYRATTLFDPYASEADQELFANGWFDKHMPDLNQNNPQVQNYLIQQTLWWAAEFGLDALRVDTYAYPDQTFMKKWRERLALEFPSLFVFAETWMHGASVQAWFVGPTGLNKDMNNQLESVTDFQLYYALNHAVNQGFGWTQGVASIYYVLAKDYMYPQADQLVTFLDNHDLARYYGVCNGDFRKYKMGVSLLATLRGIPQMLYGTEVLMSATNDHGAIREDMLGGWADDSTSYFQEEGRTPEMNEAHTFVSKLYTWRKTSEALTKGSTTQFVPEDGVYVFFRYTENQKVMVIANGNDQEKEVKLNRFAEHTASFTEGTDVITEDSYSLQGSLTLAPYEVLILELH